MNIEIWSDIVCPWCYIGKRRFEKALAESDHHNQVNIIWRSYQLDPQAPRNSSQTVNEVLAKRYGMSLQQAVVNNDRVSGLAAAEGLEYRLDRAKYTNTFDAHRLIHFAATLGLQSQMQERLMHAYFSEGADVGDRATLARLAGEVGIDSGEALAVLESDGYAGEVRADEQRARAFGVTGVPFFAIDETYGISGAQPTDVFRQVLEQVWSESHELAEKA